MTITSVNDGSSDKFYRAWADSADGSKGFSTTDSSKEYFGVYAGITPPSNYKAYSWTKIKGDSGRSVTDTEMEYAINDSKTTPPTSGWSLEMPVWKTGLFIWQRVKVSYSTGNPSYTTPHCLESNIIDDVTGNIGDWIFRDKTEILSGQEIFTDKADDNAVVHVEVEGKSWQSETGDNLSVNGNFANDLDNWFVNGTVAIDNIDGMKVIKLQGTNAGFYQYSSKQIPGYYEISFKAKSVGASSAVKYGFLNKGIEATKNQLITGNWQTYSYRTEIEIGPVREYYHFYATANTNEGVYITDITVKPLGPTPYNPIEIHSLNNVDVVSSVGKENLYTGSKNIDHTIGVNNYTLVSKLPIGTYTLSFDYDVIKEGLPLTGFLLYSSVSGGITTVPTKSGALSRTFRTFTVTKDISEGLIWLYAGSGASQSQANHVLFKNVKIEKGVVATPYCSSLKDVPYESYESTLNKINLLLDEPLRSRGDVCDRLMNKNGIWVIERNIELLHPEDGTRSIEETFGVRSNPLYENLSQEYQDKLNNLRSFKESNYVYTLFPDGQGGYY